MKKCHFKNCDEPATHVVFFPKVPFKKRPVWPPSAHEYCEKDAKWLEDHAAITYAKMPG